MGKTNGLVGGVTGKMGNLIGYYRRGKYLVRAYNPNTTNVRSRLQQRQRARWIVLMDIMRPVLNTLRTGFHYDTPGYELQNAMKANMPYVTNSNPIDTEVEYSSLKLSDGKFGGIGTAGAITTSNNTVTIPFTKGENFVDELPADYILTADSMMMVGGYCPSNKKWIQESISWDEINNNIVVQVSNDFVDKLVHFYGFLAVPPSRVLGAGIPDFCSETIYLGSATIE